MRISGQRIVARLREAAYTNVLRQVSLLVVLQASFLAHSRHCRTSDGRIFKELPSHPHSPMFVPLLNRLPPPLPRTRPPSSLSRTLAFVLLEISSRASVRMLASSENL